MEATRTDLHWLAALRAWARLRRVELIVLFLMIPIIGLSLLIKSPALRQWDAHVSYLIQQSESPLFTTLCEYATALGAGGGLFLFSIPFVLWLVRAQRPRGAFFLLMAILGHLLNVAIKLLFNRPRPGANDGVEVILAASGTSFPSGHAMAAVMFFGFLAALFMVHVRPHTWRRLGVTLSILVALLICFSRIYLGAHFVSDIVGGIAYGLLFLLLWIEVYKRSSPQEFSPVASNGTDSDAMMSTAKV